MVSECSSSDTQQEQQNPKKLESEHKTSSDSIEEETESENSESEEGSDEEDEHSASDEDAKKQQTLKPVPKQAVSQTLKSPTKQATLQAIQTSKSAQEKTENTKQPETESSEDSEEDSDDNAERPDSKTLKPVPKQAAHENENNKKPAIGKKDIQKPTESSFDSDAERPNAKKPKPVTKQDSLATPKTGNSRRVWNKDDEIRLLEWVIDCQTQDILPASNMEAFNKFMKKSEVVYEKKQVTDKISKMKRKYLINAEKWEKVDFDNPCEKKMFELSKQIWGGDGETSNSKSVKKSKNVEPMDLMEDNEMEIDQEEFWAKYPLLKKALKVHNSGSLKEEGRSAMLCDVSKIGDAWAKEMENKWKVYQAKEAELKLMELGAQTKMRMDIA